jgi:hypothetical protein
MHSRWCREAVFFFFSKRRRYSIKNINTLISSKRQIPAASYLMELAAIDWFKDTKRMDNVARQKGCVAQVSNPLNVDTMCDFLSAISYTSSSITYNVE